MSDHKHPVDPARVSAARAAALAADQAERLRALLDVIGEPVRARILTALEGGEPLCVGDLALALSLSEDTISYALRILRTHELVIVEPHGRLRYHRLADQAMRGPLLEALTCLRPVTAETGPR